MEIATVVREANKPVLLVDGATDVKYLIRAMTLLDDGKLANIEIRQGGGEGSLKHAWKALTTGDVLRQTVVLLHDCESSVSPCDRDNVHRRKVTLIEDHPIRRGTENLFSEKSLGLAMAHKPAFVDIVAEHETIERGQQRDYSRAMEDQRRREEQSLRLALRERYGRGLPPFSRSY